MTELLKLLPSEIIRRTIKYADDCHSEKDQRRKYDGAKYIVHPIRVMEKVKTVTDDICMLVASLLHDVVEDTDYKEDHVMAFLVTILPLELAKRTLKLVINLTDEYTKEKYPHLNRKKRKYLEAVRLGDCDADTQTIKYADIWDNTEDITRNDPNFSKTYIPECEDLVNEMANGNPILREKAVATLLFGRMRIFNPGRLQTCKCIYEHYTGVERSKKCTTRCEAQINVTDERDTLDMADKLVKKEMTLEEVKKQLSSIENVVKDFNGEPRRYYKMTTDPKEKELVVREAAMVLFPEMDTSDPDVVEWILEFYPVDKKIEIWPDGHAWVRTILV